MNLVSRISRWGQPFRDILMDYAEVSKDIIVGFRKRPARSVLWMVCGGTVIAMHEKRPSLRSYRNKVVEYSNELGLCAETARNNQTKSYIDEISTLTSDEYIQYINLGVFSLLIQRSESQKCHNYHSTCSYLQPRIWKIHHRVIDIGVWNQWLLLNRKMVDFDVNESEFME